MLYVSTRDKTDSFTASRTLLSDNCKDSGLFVPYRLPVFDPEEIKKLQNLTFGESVAQVLNLFYSSSLSGWDVDFAIGRHPCRIVSTNHRLYIAELWRNHTLRYRFLEQSLFTALSGESRKVTQWASIAIRIAVLFGIYSELSKQGIERFDISVTAGDFTDPMAVWYARKMGLPVETLICCTNENSAVWDLLHSGELATGAAAIHTALPGLDYVCPPSLERLLYECFGRDEVKRYLTACDRRGIYRLSPEDTQLLAKDMASAVVRSDRCEMLIRSIFRTHGYVMDPYVATAFAGLQEYRSSTGEGKAAVLLSYDTPMHYAGAVMAATGLSEQELRKRLNYARGE